jgi:hypothetical protein
MRRRRGNVTLTLQRTFTRFVRVQSYAPKARECNCLRGQVNGHKATLYFTLSTTYLGTLSSLTNFAEFLAFRALCSPVLCRGAIASGYIGPGLEGLGPEFGLAV